MAKRKRHPGTIEERGDSLRVILYAGGKRHTFTLVTKDEREAVEFAKRKHEELQREVGRVRRGLPGRMAMSELLDKFEAQRLPHLAPNSQKTHRISLATFRTFFGQLGNPPVSEVGRGNVMDYLSRRQGQVSARTVVKDRGCLHAVFAFAEALELRDGNPVTKGTAVKAENRNPVILDADQYAALLRECEGRPMLALYVTTLAEAGLRCDSEALHLQWPDVDLEEGFLWIDSGRGGHRTKSGKSRWVPMTATLKQAMKDHFARFRFATYDGKWTDWVFHHLTTRNQAKAGERISDLRRAFKSAAARAKLPADLHQHDLRHRRATTWIAEGRDVALVKEAMGHADLRTTMGYVHLVRENLRSLVEDERQTPNTAVAS